MSSVVQVAPPRAKLSTLPLDQDRGVQAMWLLIATEAMLFACMFAAYYYLGNNKDRWAHEAAPDLWVPFTCLAIVLAGGAALVWGGRALRAGNQTPARLALVFTTLCAMGFLALEGFEFSFMWSTTAPYNDSYGSIFYAIDFLDCAHVAAGIFVLGFAAMLPNIGPSNRTPHYAYKTAALYWYFVIALWFAIVVLLYVIPNLQKLSA